MAQLANSRGSKRPITYQLWLTSSKLCQTQTFDAQVETEQLPYPAEVTTTSLDELMHQSLGSIDTQVTLTLSSEQVRQIRDRGVGPVEPSMGEMIRTTKDGVVFMEPPSLRNVTFRSSLARDSSVEFP